MRYVTKPVAIYILLLIVLSVPNTVMGADLGSGGFCTPSFPKISGPSSPDLPTFEKAGYPASRNSPFRAETRFRAVFLNMTEGKLKLPTGEIDLSSDLGLNKKASLIETMMRTQLGRYSMRMHYDTYLKKFQGTESNLQWPEFRVGVDMDLFNSNGVRLGLDADVTWDKPKFSFSSPTTGPQLITWQRPMTVGAHLLYNPNSSSMSSSFEFRYRRSFREGVDTTIMEEAEISGGLRFPGTTVGTSTLRGGWRYSVMRFDAGDRQVDIKWSGMYAEYVYYY